MRILYVKTNSQRSKKYQIRTTLYQDKDKVFVKKEAVQEESIVHLKKMKLNYQYLKKAIINSNIRLAEIIDETENSLTFEFIDGISAEELFNNAVKEGEESVQQFIRKFQSTIEKGFKTSVCNKKFQPDFFNLFGNVNTLKLENKLCFSEVSNVDLIFSNIIYKDNIMYIVDYEWVYNCSVPIDYIIFRSVNNQIGSFRHNMDAEVISLFHSMENHFQNFIVNDEQSFFSFSPNFQKNRLAITQIFRREKFIFKVQRIYRYFLGKKISLYDSKKDH